MHVSAKGKQPYKTEVVVEDRDTSSLHVNLVEEQGPPGLSADSVERRALVDRRRRGARGRRRRRLLLLKPGDNPAAPPPGTLGGFDL